MLLTLRSRWIMCYRESGGGRDHKARADGTHWTEVEDGFDTILNL